MKIAQIDRVCALALTLMSIVYVTICLGVAKLKYRYSGSWLYLLIGVQVGQIAFFITTALKVEIDLLLSN